MGGTLKVLVVDDEPGIRLAVARVLEPHRATLPDETEETAFDVAQAAVEDGDLLAKFGDLGGQLTIALVGHLQPVQQRIAECPPPVLGERLLAADGHAQGVVRAAPACPVVRSGRRWPDDFRPDSAAGQRQCQHADCQAELP